MVLAVLIRPVHRPCQTPGRGGWKRGVIAAVVGCWMSSGCAKPPTPVEQAALLSEKGQDAAAVTLLQGYLQQHPAAIAERRLLIRLYAVTSDLGRAEKEAAILASHLPPASPVPWVEMGHVMEIAHRYEEALSMYDRAAEVAPRDPLGPRAGGLRAAQWGEPEVAAPRLEEALRRNPRAADVWHALGLVRLSLGDLDGAATAYRSGLVADPAALENRIGLATVALERHAPADALHEYDALLRARPGFADGYLGRAWALLALGRFGDAEASLEEARRHGADAHSVNLQMRLLTTLAKRARAAPRDSGTKDAERGSNP
jgi:tetratricopeptide (TPR) repeat protein